MSDPTPDADAAWLDRLLASLHLSPELAGLADAVPCAVPAGCLREMRNRLRSLAARLAEAEDATLKDSLEIAFQKKRAETAERLRDTYGAELLAIKALGVEARIVESSAERVAIVLRERAETAERKLYAEEERAEAINRALGSAEATVARLREVVAMSACRNCGSEAPRERNGSLCRYSYHENRAALAAVPPPRPAPEGTPDDDKVDMSFLRAAIQPPLPPVPYVQPTCGHSGHGHADAPCPDKPVDPSGGILPGNTPGSTRWYDNAGGFSDTPPPADPKGAGA